MSHLEVKTESLNIGTDLCKMKKYLVQPFSSMEGHILLSSLHWHKDIGYFDMERSNI